MITVEKLKKLIDEELASVSDSRVLEQIRRLSIDPKPVARRWDYGEHGEAYVCWTVLDHDGGAIVYCEEGFGPKHPWGLVWIDGSMGDDSGWFARFLDAYFDSFAVTELPIWRVFKDNTDGRMPVTEELSWNEAWTQVEELRASDPESRYAPDHTIGYVGRS